MDFLKGHWIWIWVMVTSLSFWMAWPLMRATLFFFDAEILSFFAISIMCLFSYFDSVWVLFVSKFYSWKAWLWITFKLHQHIWPANAGMMSKVCKNQTLILLSWMMQNALYFCFCCVDLAVAVVSADCWMLSHECYVCWLLNAQSWMLCKRCLLILFE